MEGDTQLSSVSENSSDVSTTDHMTGKRAVNSPSKVNESVSGTGALRYALHLRFLCPHPKKILTCIQRCKSDPLSAPARKIMKSEERCFYLYNDLKVVFPQRHSDADEGKVWIVPFVSYSLVLFHEIAYCFWASGFVTETTYNEL